MSVFQQLVLMVAAASAGTVHTVALEGRDGLAFRIECPSGWTVSGEAFEALERQVHVLATLTNASGRDLRYTASVETLDVALPSPPTHEEAPSDSFRVMSGISTRHRFDLDRFAEGLPVGVVYGDIALMTGTPLPPSCGSYAWYPAESPDRAIPRLRAGGDFTRETEEAVEWRVSFVRWGRTWMVRLVARKPVVPERLQEILASLETLDFPVTPAVNRHVAVDAAISRLPASMRPPPDEERGCGCGPYRVRVDSLGTGYRLEFQVLDGTPANRVVLSRGYDVDRDGTVAEWGR